MSNLNTSTANNSASAVDDINQADMVIEE